MCLYDVVLTRDYAVVSVFTVAVTERAGASAAEEEVETEAMGAEEEAGAEVATAEVVVEAMEVAEVMVATAATTVATEVAEVMATAEDMEVATVVVWRTEGDLLATVVRATSVPIRCLAWLHKVTATVQLPWELEACPWATAILTP